MTLSKNASYNKPIKKIENKGKVLSPHQTIIKNSSLYHN